MARVEVLLALGFILGAVFGILASWAWRKWLAWRDAHRDSLQLKSRVRVQLAEASTDDLIEEVSKRDDLNEVGSKR